MPYGETWFQEGNTDNAPKYNSQELDKESGFYFYNARYYDASVSRFVTPDTVIDGEYSVKGWNRYMYCGGNPIQYKDPTGHNRLGKIRPDDSPSQNNAKKSSSDSPPTSKQKANSAIKDKVKESINGKAGSKKFPTRQDTIKQFRIWQKGNSDSIVQGEVLTWMENYGTRTGRLPSLGEIENAGNEHDTGKKVYGAFVGATTGGALGTRSIVGRLKVSQSRSNVSSRSSIRGQAGRARNKLKPDHNATGNHTSIKRNADGKITNYGTYEKNSRNPTGYDIKKRVDLQGKSHGGVDTPHVHEGGGVRPANLSEIPKN